MRSCVVKMWNFRRKQPRQRIKGDPGPKRLQVVLATEQREKRDDVKSYVDIQRDVTKLLKDQHCFALHMGVASDVNIRRVVTRVQFDQRYFAQHMGAASDANILTVVTRLQTEKHCFA
jgi:hypothetical protein